ncbi:tyrosine recombinase XerD [Mesobacillus boroniphilus JCM 21738]|uniref:Tyrosine recombinase XerD n=1 Tax=Mesobacillus boroniphilus JCM 21738 TaxID=1294265 RepID=W4RG41_9BACI|nr:tyrosine recombinase XerD [Mesobacillus boroniphilus JCM 21738]
MEDRLDDFIHFLVVEKGLSKNTIVSYKRDLNSYITYLRKIEQLGDLNGVQRAQIVHFLGHLKDTGKSSKTLARHIARSGLFIISCCVKRLLTMIQQSTSRVHSMKGPCLKY